MPILDFIKNRQKQQAETQPSQQQKPETAKEMYAQQSVQEGAARKSVRDISEADQAHAKDLGARVDKLTEPVRQNSAPQTSAPADTASSPEPMRQNMVSQDKQAPDLSPTSAQKGQTAKDRNVSSPQRDRGGWER